MKYSPATCQHPVAQRQSWRHMWRTVTGCSSAYSASGTYPILRPAMLLCTENSTSSVIVLVRQPSLPSIESMNAKPVPVSLPESASLVRTRLESSFIRFQ